MIWNEYLVSRAACDLLHDYLPGYIGVVERRHELKTHLPMPKPHSYIAASQAGTGTPGLGDTRIYAICPGLAEAPEETPEGGYNAVFALMVGVEILNRKDREEVNAHLGYYLEAMRESILREGFKVFGTVVIDFSDSATDEGDPAMALTSGAGVVTFTVYLPEIVASTQTLFPDGPPLDPYDPVSEDGPIIQHVEEEIFAFPVSEPLP